MPGGYAGKLLYINLNERSVKEESITDQLALKWIGANGFAARRLYLKQRPGSDAFDPNNEIIIGAGPLVGTSIPFSPKVYLAAKSPLTGCYFDSVAGGHFGAELKYAGYDAVIVSGKSKIPVYIWINDGQVEFREALHLWGKGTREAQKIIKQDLSQPDAQCLCVGPAGENLVRYACVIAGVRAAGRGGLGAVLGSKNLKAVVARGTGDLALADPDRVEEIGRNIREQRFPGSTLDKGYSSRGTPILPEIFNPWGLLGTRNWQEEQFEGGEGLYHTDNLARLEVKRVSCQGCYAKCGGIHLVKNGPYQGAMSEGPEYETEYALGSCLGISDIAAVIEMDRLCDDLGLDTISTGLTISFAMECFQKGLLKKDRAGGIELQFGDDRMAVELVKKIAYREGLGNLLAEGSKRAAEKIGGGASYYAIQTKGLEHPGHSTRGTKGMGLGYAIGTRGAHHHDGRDFEYHANPLLGYDGDRTSTAGKGYMQGKITRWTAAADAMGYCHFVEKVFGIILCQDHVDILNAVTGLGLTLEQLQEVGERIYTTERAFNVREGVNRTKDTLPDRFFTEPIPGGPSAGAVFTREELDGMLDEFYEDYRWDRETGIPTLVRWQELGLPAGLYPLKFNADKDEKITGLL